MIFPHIDVTIRVTKWFEMAGKPLHWKERNGRYSARLVVPVQLRPYLGKRRELEIQLGGDRRTALRNHAAAVASIQKQIGIARQKYELATGKKGRAVPYPLTAQQIALRDYESQIAFDVEIRAHDPRHAQGEPDPAYEAHPFRDGYAGKLSDDDLEELVGARIERVRLAGNTNAVKGTPEWRMLAQALCVASYEAIARQYERNDGDFTGQPSHPLLVNVAEPVEAEPDPITFNTVIDEEMKRRGRGKDAKPLPASTIQKFRTHCGSFAKWRKSENVLTVTALEGKSWIEALQSFANSLAL